MSKRAIGLLLVFLILSVVAVQTGRELVYSIAYLLGITLLFSFLWAWSNLSWVRLTRVTQSLRTQVGKPVEERIVVENRSWLPKLWLEVRDASELPDHHVSRVVHSIPARRMRSWSIKSNARQRGRYRLGPMQLVSGDPFGLFVFKRELPQTSYITVYPATYDLPGFAPAVGHLAGGEARRQRTVHVTPNFAGIRDYVPGDSFNRIHWRSSAKAGRLLVKEFEEDPTADIWIVLDMYHRTFTRAPEPEDPLLSDSSLAWLVQRTPEVQPSTTDYAVTVAASVMKHFLSQNRSVGMITHAKEREILQPDRGLRPLTRALEHLAVLEAEGRRTLREVLVLEEAFFTRGTTVVLITSSTHTAWVDAMQELKRRGVRAVAVLVNPTSFDPTAPTIDLVRAALAVQGVPAYVVNYRDAIPQALALPADRSVA